MDLWVATRTLIGGGVNLGQVKAALVILLTLLLFIAGVPIAVGHADHMGDCPACTHAESRFVLDMTAALLMVVTLAIVFAGSRVWSRRKVFPILALTSGIYRPPRYL